MQDLRTVTKVISSRNYLHNSIQFINEVKHICTSCIYMVDLSIQMATLPIQFINVVKNICTSYGRSHYTGGNFVGMITHTSFQPTMCPKSK